MLRKSIRSTRQHLSNCMLRDLQDASVCVLLESAERHKALDATLKKQQARPAFCNC